MAAYDHDNPSTDAPAVSGTPAPLFDHSTPPPAQQLPWWLVEGPPKIQRQPHPDGATSPTWLRRMATCPRNHAKVYRHKLEVNDEKGQEARVGNVVHAALEWAATRRIRQTRQLPTTASVYELLHLAGFHPDAQDVAVLNDAREILKAFGSVALPGVVAVEKLVSEWLLPGVLIAGRLDMEQVEGPPHAQVVTVTDFKSGSSGVPDEDEVFFDPQVAFYLIALRRQYPRAAVIRGRVWNVRTNDEVVLDWSPVLEETWFAFSRALWHAWDMRDETPKAGKHCDWCPFRVDCPEIQKITRAAALKPAPGSLAAMRIEDLIHVYRQAKIAGDAAEATRSEASKLILDLMGKKQRSYRAGHLSAYRKRKPRPKWEHPGTALVDMAQAADVAIADLLELVVDVKTNKIKGWINTLPDSKREQVMAVFRKHCVKGPGVAYLDVRESKKVADAFGF